jgi:hypothetical protein
MERIIEKLRELNEPVPKPLRLPSQEEIHNVENEFGLEFHPDYVRYLLEASDVVFGTLEPATIPVDSGHTFIGNVVNSARKMGVPKTLVPIAEDNGDYYCMNESGEILYWSHNGVTDEKWPSLESWIQEVWVNGN